jgi:O-antigen ligase
MKAVRIGICTLLAIGVLSFGATGPAGAFLLEIGAAALFLLWGALVIRRRKVEIHWNWLYVPLLALGVVAMAQYAFGISVYPYLTKIELLKWASYGLLFFLATESFRTGQQRGRFVWFLLGLGFVVSLFGIIQYFTFNGKIYWLASVPAGAGPFGPFVDRDHFAGFVELIAPLGLALLLFRSRRREQVPLLLLFTIVPIGALVLSASRGGIISLVGEFALLAFLSRADRTRRKRLLGAVAIVLVGCSFIVWLGVSKAIQRFEQLSHAGISQELRLSIYRDTWRIFLDHPVVGTGLGTFVVVYPGYASFYDGRTIEHAHNDYLELLGESGLLGGLTCVAFIGLLFWRGFAGLHSTDSSFARAIVAGSLTACTGMLIHSLVDFNLHIPSNGLLFLLLANVATAESRELSQARIQAARMRSVQRSDSGLFISGNRQFLPDLPSHNLQQ